MISVITNIFGGLALVVMVLSYQQKTAKKVLMLQLISTLLFAAHFGLKGANTGLVLNVISGARAYVFSQKDKKWASGKIWLYAFIIVSIISGILTWQTPFAIFPMIAMIFTTIGFYADTAKKMRLITLPNSPLWMIYNGLFAHSIFAVATDLFTFVSTIVGIIRLDTQKKTRR
ncbi:MAG: YgjV family protein [Eubacteriales bacterium]|nr:YgjV family protein [Eubacteriales bacterium]